MIDSSQCSSEQFRVVYVEKPEGGKPKREIAATGDTLESVKWMHDALSNPAEYPDVLWCRIEYAAWHVVESYVK